MEDIKQAVDDVIYSWSKLKEVLENVPKDVSKRLQDNFPLDTDTVTVLQRLIDWRIQLDSID